jgi:hypothetical protein
MYALRRGSWHTRRFPAILNFVIRKLLPSLLNREKKYFLCFSSRGTTVVLVIINIVLSTGFGRFFIAPHPNNIHIKN